MENKTPDKNKDIYKPLIESVISDTVMVIKRLELIRATSPELADHVLKFVHELLEKTKNQTDEKTDNV